MSRTQERKGDRKPDHRSFQVIFLIQDTPTLKEFICSDDAVHQRIDSYLHKLFKDYSRTYIQKIIKQGQVFVDGQTINAGFRLANGQTVSMHLPKLVASDIQAEAIPLDVVFEDDHLVVIDKPAGMVTHPAAGHQSHTLVNALLHHCPNLKGIGEVKRPGIVHRLDMDTSGLIVVAKDEPAFKGLKEQWEKRTIIREYLALCLGPWADPQIIVDAPIGRHPTLRKKMAVTAQSSKPAVTEFTLIENMGDFALVKAKLKTGRTHQIRVHLAYLKSPLVGDQLYAGKKLRQMFARQALHAQRLGFAHPLSGELIDLTSKPPKDMQALLEQLRQG